MPNGPQALALPTLEEVAMNATDKRKDLATRPVAGGATDRTPTGHGSPRLRSSYHEDVNEAPAMVDQEPVDVETAAPLIGNTPIEGWVSDAVDPEAEIPSGPDE